MKASFTTTPFFIHANPSKTFVLETNASSFALSTVLSQLRENNFLHLVGFHSCKFFPTEINYKIHDKEFLAIVDAFKEWCHLLEKAQHEIIVYSNHKNVQYFMMIVCWIDIKINGHYPCLNLGLWILIIQGDHKGNQMHYLITRTLHLKKEMLFTINNVTPFSNPKPSASSIVDNSWK